MLGTVIYFATAPIRLFGRSRLFRMASAGMLVTGLFFAVTLWTLDTFMPGPGVATPTLAELPPLPPASRASTIVTPVRVSLTAIRDALDASAPRTFSGATKNPISDVLGKAEIGVSVNRGTLAVSGRPETLGVSAPLSGSVHVSGQFIGKAAGAVGGAIGSLLGDSGIGKKIESTVSKPLDQTVALNGSVTMTMRPALTANWRVEPNLAAQFSFRDTAINIAGLKLDLANEIKPVLDPIINEQIATLQARLRNDPTIERIARREWQKMCRALPFGGGGSGMPKLWLEMKPKRAFAAQPTIDGQSLTLIVGVQAETRVGPAETKPQCPFPATLMLSPPIEPGRLSVGVPIDLPFTDVNKLLESQMKGQTFPNDKNSPVEVEVRKASVHAAGERLLISLLVKARERKSWFGFGAEATVHVWGKPVLDQKMQVLRFTELTLAVESTPRSAC